MNNFIKKVTSRKFIVTAVLIASGLAAAFQNANNVKLRMAVIIIAGIAGIAYSAIEGKIDKASVEKTALDILEGLEVAELKTEEEEEKEG